MLPTSLLVFRPLFLQGRTDVPALFFVCLSSEKFIDQKKKSKPDQHTEHRNFDPKHNKTYYMQCMIFYV